MRASALRPLLAELAAASRGQALLWRGAELTGRDVDLLVAGTALADAATVLLDAGLRPARASHGHVLWSDPAGALPPIDVLPAAAWPDHYPDLAGVLARAAPGDPLPVTSPEDRLLILAADAVAGRPLAKIAAKARPLLATDAAVRGRLAALAASEGAGALACLVSDLSQRPAAPSERLPYRRAGALARDSRRARAALRRRLGARFSMRSRRSATGPPLIAASGMDGSGKSTVTTALEDRLVRRGVEVERAWARLGAEVILLDRVARPVKRLLGREGTIADPVAAAGPSVAKLQDPRAATGRRGPLEWTWILIVAAVNARSLRAHAGRRRSGTAVVCDRWVPDALVDLELRYGRHRAAEWLLRRLVPRPDLALYLEVDPAMAAARKPGDKALATLERMQELYERRARTLRLTRLDANQPAQRVAAQAAVLVELLLADRGRA